LFGLAAGLQLLVEAAGWSRIEFWVKPSLMPLLMAAVWSATRKPFPRPVRLLLLGLFLSWMGDVFLLPWPEADFFAWGLAAFLLAHLCYISAMFQQPGARKRGLLKKKPGLVFPALLLLSGLLFWLWPGIVAEMRLPVVLYAGIIVAMVLSAIHIHPLVAVPYRHWLVADALLFLLSDALLAAGRFRESTFLLPAAGFWVMLTYMAGQAGIAAGLSGSSRNTAA
jgi:uncharacterized membrane protein YhhN